MTMVYKIQSRRNPRILKLIKEKENFFFFEGLKLVQDIILRQLPISFLIINENKIKQLSLSPKTKIKEIWHVSPEVLAKISSLKQKSDFIAVVEWIKSPIDFQKSEVIIALDNIQDPANVGSIFRCASAFGVNALALTGNCVKLNNNKLLRTAQNSIMDIHCEYFNSLDELLRKAQRNKFHIYLTSSHGIESAIKPDQIQKPCLILFGNEGQGLPQCFLKKFSSLIIPQTNQMESLNVGVSACIIMYEIYKTK